LKRSTGAGLRSALARRLAPCSEARIKLATFLAVEARGQLACRHGCAQARGNGLPHLPEDLDQAPPNGLAVIARFGGEVAEEAAVAHAVAIEPLLAGIDPYGEALQRRQRVIAQRLADQLAAAGEIAIEDLEPEGFLRGEVIGERALRHAGGMNDVADARSPEPALVHDAQALGQDLLSVGRSGHVKKYVRP